LKKTRIALQIEVTLEVPVYDTKKKNAKALSDIKRWYKQDKRAWIPLYIEDCDEDSADVVKVKIREKK
jgi:hypothetical protein